MSVPGKLVITVSIKKRMQRFPDSPEFVKFILILILNLISIKFKS